MPREIVKSRDGNYDVKVGWNPVGSVQVGVETADDLPLVWQLFGTDESLSMIGQFMRKLNEQIAIDKSLTDQQIGHSILEALVSVHPTFQGVWSDLDRPEINQLIKLLRRARDAAYGKDE